MKRRARSAVRPSALDIARNEAHAARNRLSLRARGLYARVMKRFDPPPVLKLSQWAEQNIILPEGQSARAGNRWRNWPYMVEILDSIADPECTRVVIKKGARLGFTKGIMVAIGATAATDPCGIILLVPTGEDATGFAVDELEPLFESSPALDGILRKGRNDGRNTLTRKSLLGGGSIKILAARSPRALRRHDAKKLFCDEVDAMEITKEGDPIKLAEMRTFAHPDRKIVIGSTPTEEDVSIIDKEYEASDKRIFEVPCPHCGTFFEILWPHIRWPEGEPDKAVCICPHCEDAHREGKAGPPEPITDRDKPAMAAKGVWRATAPNVIGIRGYQINTLVSGLGNAAWGKLAAEFVKAKKSGPADHQVFVNTVEARVWKTSLNRIDAGSLMDRTEPFGLAPTDYRATGLPAWVLALTAGVDTQDDRLEVTILGWAMFGPPAVLAHLVIEGNTLDAATWKELDTLLRQKWLHPAGWWLGIDASAVDSGGHEGRTQKVYDFCDPKAFRRIFAIKGDEGPLPVWKKARKVKGGSRLAIIGVDQLKSEIMQRLGAPQFDERGGPNPMSLRLSEDLPEDYFEQVTGEILRTRYVRNRVIKEWKPKSRGQRVEALDCTVYAWAVRQSPAFRSVPMQARAAQLAAALADKPQTPAAPPLLDQPPGPASITRAAPASPAPAANPGPPQPARGTDWASLFNQE